MSEASSNPNVGAREFQDLLAMGGEGIFIVPAGETVQLKDSDGNWTTHGVFKNRGTQDATIVSAKQKVIGQGKKILPPLASVVIPAGETDICKVFECTVTAASDGDLWCYYA
jgi:hypothetical protein